MYKLTAVLLAACLVNIHAYVKRDTEPVKNDNYLEQIKNQFQEISKSVGGKLSETFNPDQLKKGISDALDKLSNALEFNKKNEKQQQSTE